MSELAKQIIRQQWPERHSPNRLVRRQARSLIHTHVELLRQWRQEKDETRARELAGAGH